MLLNAQSQWFHDWLFFECADLFNPGKMVTLTSFRPSWSWEIQGFCSFSEK